MQRCAKSQCTERPSCVDVLQPIGALPSDHRQKQCIQMQIWGKSESNILLIGAKDKTTETRKQHYAWGMPRNLHLLVWQGFGGQLSASHSLESSPALYTSAAGQHPSHVPKHQGQKEVAITWALCQKWPLAPSDTHSKPMCSIRRILLFYWYFSYPLNTVTLPSRSPPEHSLLFTSIKLRYDRILTIHCKIVSDP